MTISVNSDDDILDEQNDNISLNDIFWVKLNRAIWQGNVINKPLLIWSITDIFKNKMDRYKKIREVPLKKW